MPKEKESAAADAPKNTTTAKNADLGQKELQETFDKANEQGFFGVEVDPTPNENYSLETPPDAPTPETDAKLAAEVREHTKMGKSAIELAAEKESK